jgi:hypothetical protein
MMLVLNYMQQKDILKDAKEHQFDFQWPELQPHAAAFAQPPPTSEQLPGVQSRMWPTSEGTCGALPGSTDASTMSKNTSSGTAPNATQGMLVAAQSAGGQPDPQIMRLTSWDLNLLNELSKGQLTTPVASEPYSHDADLRTTSSTPLPGPQHQLQQGTWSSFSVPHSPLAASHDLEQVPSSSLLVFPSTTLNVKAAQPWADAFPLLVLLCHANN